MSEELKQINDISSIDINDFNQERQCTYKGERYSVRDNGAVLRHTPKGKRARPTDNKWTFGKENSANPYLNIAGVRVHRIIATAFHGDPPDTKYVVDHIDTNCRNNRPENLRWLSRLENALNNPITRKEIEYLCGSIEAFLENPSMLNELQTNPSFKWMRSVTSEEAKNCMVRMSLWVNSDNKPTKSTNLEKHKISFGERVFKPLQKWEVGLAREPGLELALTPWCAQYMWRPDAYFPSCPQNIGADPLNDYFKSLKTGAELAYSNHDDIFPKLNVLESKLLKEKSSILVLAERVDDKWTIVGIEFDKKSKHFIHFILGTYSSKDEADATFRKKNELTDFWSEAYANIYNNT